MMKFKYRLLFGALLVASLVVGCGGGATDEGASEDSKSMVSMFVTDNLSTDFDKVWVTVKNVTLISDTATEVVVYDDAAGQVFNLSELAGIGELLSSTAVAPGTYTSIKVTLDDEVSLVHGDDPTITAHFNNTGTDEVVSVPATLVVTADAPGSLALDFDLANFTYDDDTGLVTPNVKVKDEDEVKDLDQVVAHVKGEVIEIVDEDSFVIETHRKHGQAELTVDLADDATITNEDTGAAVVDLSGLTVGQKVHVAGNFDPATLSVEASSVVLLSSDHEDEHNSDGSHSRAEVRGVITAFDGANATINILDANFVPPSSTMPIAALADAHFVRGSLATLEVGQEVEIKGSWDGTTLTAKLIKIEGATDHDGKVAEFQGTIISFENNMLSVNVLQHNNAAGELGSPITFDATNVFIKKGRLSCLVADTKVKVKGGITEQGFDPSVIEIKDKCGALLHDDDSDDEDGDDDDSDEDGAADKNEGHHRGKGKGDDDSDSGHGGG